MSNDVVGKLYLSIIDGVVDDSRTDFEDNGVDEMTLQELKSIWQQRLSTFDIAKMPWDPEPQPPVKTEENYQATSNGTTERPSYTSGSGSVPPDNTEYPVKKEPSDGVGSSSLYINASQAALRAAKNVQQFAQENQAANGLPGVDETVRGIMRKGEIDNHNNNTNSGNGGNEGGGLVLPGGGQLSQLDGANDNDDEYISTTAQIDESIRTRANNEGGIELEIEIPKKILAQMDGAEDDDDDDDAKDENGINSDLDDSDDDLAFGEEEDNDEAGMTMLCLYDKVQRVKNKWKYVLKDGVVNVHGKDYVFNRASGESEW